MIRADLSPATLPLWPDAEDQITRAAPDGHPWRKACDVCAYRKTSTMPEEARYRAPHTIPHGTHFYCVHRQDGKGNDACDRVCASYASLNAMGKILR